MSVKKSSIRKACAKRPALVRIEGDYDLCAPLAVFLGDMEKICATGMAGVLTTDGPNVRMRFLSWPRHLSERECERLYVQLINVCTSFAAAHPAKTGGVAK